MNLLWQRYELMNGRNPTAHDGARHGPGCFVLRSHEKSGRAPGFLFANVHVLMRAQLLGQTLMLVWYQKRHRECRRWLVAAGATPGLLQGNAQALKCACYMHINTCQWLKARRLR